MSVDPHVVSLEEIKGRSHAFDEGRASYRAGLSERDCPYITGVEDKLRADWFEGHASAADKMDEL